MTTTDIFRAEALAGLAHAQKTISPKWLYDDAGSALFEDITQVKEYYPTRTEAKIFDRIMPTLHQRFGTGMAIAEYGSGASVKTRKLLDTLQPTTYVPIDIADAFLQEVAQTLKKDYPDTSILPVVADFMDIIPLPERFLSCPDRMGFFPGSTIGNMVPSDRETFMRDAGQSLGAGAWFLLGADLDKDPAVLEAAYDDAEGVTAAFNMNLLTRMNRELGTNFDLEAFSHQARYNKEVSRVEMHLVSDREQQVRLGDDLFHFDANESIHTESSYKFTRQKIADLANQTGWTLMEMWTDDQDWFGVFLLRRV
ncbi:MAG: L-histidine N(alpha)-methyltransferase [Parvularcula sp.]